MKEITFEEVLHVVSEPGDATRYNYIVYQEVDNFYFCSAHGPMRYPHFINYYDVKNASTDTIIDLAEDQQVNPYTYAECARTAIELIENAPREQFITFGLYYRSRE